MTLLREQLSHRRTEVSLGIDSIPSEAVSIPQDIFIASSCLTITLIMSIMRYIDGLWLDIACSSLPEVLLLSREHHLLNPSKLKHDSRSPDTVTLTYFPSPDATSWPNTSELTGRHSIVQQHRAAALSSSYDKATSSVTCGAIRMKCTKLHNTICRLASWISGFGSKHVAQHLPVRFALA